MEKEELPTYENLNEEQLLIDKVLKSIAYKIHIESKLKL